MPSLSDAPHDVQRKATCLGVLVPPSAQENALERMRSADMRLQRNVLQSRRHGECLLDGRKALVAIYPRECTAQLQQRPHLLIVAAVLSRVAGTRREILDRIAHGAHGAAQKPELLEQTQSRGDALTVR